MARSGERRPNIYLRALEGFGQPLRARQPDIARILLIDPAGIFKGSNRLRETFSSKLEEKFNSLDPRWLNQANFRFRAQFIPHEPSDQEKAAFGRLDFPVYLLGKQHGPRTVENLMTQHKIPKTINEQDLYRLAKDCWEQRDTRGCGIPSGSGFRKIGFIKTHRVFEDATGELWQAFVNVTAHEIGHMGNRLQHSKRGLMKYPVPLNVSIEFDNDDKYSFLGNLLRLRGLRENPTIQQFRWVFR